jgi:hypothetical protein
MVSIFFVNSLVPVQLVPEGSSKDLEFPVVGCPIKVLLTKAWEPRLTKKIRVRRPSIVL